MRASSLSVLSWLCCRRRVVRCDKPSKAPSSTREILFCWRSRLVKLSYPTNAPSWRTLIWFWARRRWLGTLDQVFEVGMEVRCRRWQSTKTSPDSVDSKQLGVTNLRGPDLLWRRAPRTLPLFKHVQNNSNLSWFVHGQWCLKDGLSRNVHKNKSIPVPCKLESRFFKASAPPWSFHLDGRQHQEQQRGYEEKGDHAHPEPYTVFFSAARAWAKAGFCGDSCWAWKHSRSKVNRVAVDGSQLVLDLS